MTKRNKVTFTPLKAKFVKAQKQVKIEREKYQKLVRGHASLIKGLSKSSLAVLNLPDALKSLLKIFSQAEKVDKASDVVDLIADDLDQSRYDVKMVHRLR